MSKPRAERALIHGLYSKVITKTEQAETVKIGSTNIEGEIAYLRTLCSRLAAIADANGLKSGNTKPLSAATIRTLNALDLKFKTLLHYVRTQAYMQGVPNEYDRQIEEGEFLARKRRNVFNYLSTGKKTPKSHGPSGLGHV